MQGDIVTGINLMEPTADSLVWIYQVGLSDSVKNDGIMNFSFNGKDLADNLVEIVVLR